MQQELVFRNSIVSLLKYTCRFQLSIVDEVLKNRIRVFYATQLDIDHWLIPLSKYIAATSSRHYPFIKQKSIPAEYSRCVSSSAAYLWTEWPVSPFFLLKQTPLTPYIVAFAIISNGRCVGCIVNGRTRGLDYLLRYNLVACTSTSKSRTLDVTTLIMRSRYIRNLMKWYRIMEL